MNETITEAEAWTRFKGGDQLAGQRLAELYYPKVVQLARLLARRRRVHADDLVGEGAIALMQALQRFDPSRGFLFWTFAERAVRGAMIRSTQRRLPTVTDAFGDEAAPEAAAQSPAVDVSAQRREVLGSTLQGLDDDSRAVILLALVEDMSDAEIGRVLGCTPAAAAATRHQAMDSLRPDKASTPGLWR